MRSVRCPAGDSGPSPAESISIGFKTDARIDEVKRFALAAVVALLTLSASGLSGLLITEPCAGNELAGQSDSACPPTCVTCGCCAQAVEPAAVVVASSPDELVSDIDLALPDLPDIDPRPILHVPKLRVA